MKKIREVEEVICDISDCSEKAIKEINGKDYCWEHYILYKQKKCTHKSKYIHRGLSLFGNYTITCIDCDKVIDLFNDLNTQKKLEELESEEHKAVRKTRKKYEERYHKIFLEKINEEEIKNEK